MSTQGKEIARLEQRKFGAGKQTFVLHEDGALLVALSKGGNIQYGSISLMGWDPEPSHARNVPKLSRIVLIIVSVVLCIFMALVILLAMFSAPDKGGAIAVVICMFVIFGILWWVLYSQYLLQSYDVLIFCDTSTGAQLAPHNNLPNEKEFSDFVEVLKATVRKYPQASLANTQSTPADLREFARLRDDGILTAEEYEEAKRKWLSNIEPSPRIGFHT